MYEYTITYRSPKDGSQARIVVHMANYAQAEQAALASIPGLRVDDIVRIEAQS